MAAPASAPAPPLARRGAAYAGAGPSSPRRHPDTLRGRDPRLGCGWTRFPAHFVAGTRSAKVGGVLRGTLPRSCARLRRASGRGARECGTRQIAASPTPPPIRASGFALRLKRALKGRFWPKIVRFGLREAHAPFLLAQNQPPKALPGRPQLAPSLFAAQKSRGHLLFGRPACQSRTPDRAWHRPDRASAFGAGVGPSALQGMVSQSSDIY